MTHPPPPRNHSPPREGGRLGRTLEECMTACVQPTCTYVCKIRITAGVRRTRRGGGGVVTPPPPSTGQSQSPAQWSHMHSSHSFAPFARRRRSSTRRLQFSIVRLSSLANVSTFNFQHFSFFQIKLTDFQFFNVEVRKLIFERATHTVRRT